MVLILCKSLIPANDPVPTPAGPTQLKVGDGDRIYFAKISVNLRLDSKNFPLLMGEL